jgi:mannitol-1-phosphate 5-dehydrogenase
MKKSVIYGAGNIGRGFIGQLFSESGYEVVFIDINQELVDRLNADGKYPIRILSHNGSREIIINNVRAVNGNNQEKAALEIADADIMATSAGVNALPKITATIAEGLKKRWKNGNMKPLNIIICENLIDANKYLAQLIEKELNPKEKEFFRSYTGLVEASVGRMVPVMTEEMLQGNITRVCVEEYNELPVDKDGFRGPIPEIKNIFPFNPFDFFIQRKLYIHNMGHALTAYLGNLKGYTYIWEAIDDPLIRQAVIKAMQESALALSNEHEVPLDDILLHIDDLLHRFSNKLLGDTISRVGRDVKRKLSPGDRLSGTAKLCLKHGIFPTVICLGIAAAMNFNPGTELIISGGKNKMSPERILTEICQLNKDDELWDTILDYFNQIKNKTDIDLLLK